MPDTQDRQAQSTEELKAVQSGLERHQRFAEGKFGHVKGRKQKKLHREAQRMGEFTPEKTTELELVRQVLNVRKQALQLLQQAKEPPAPTTPSAPVRPGFSPDAPWGRETEWTLASPEIVRETWERNFTKIQEKGGEGLYGPRSNHIWEGILAMHQVLHWYQWGTSTMQQDHTNKPILFNIAPNDPTFGGERYGIGTIMHAPGLNAHGAQQYAVTDTWAGISMLQAHSHHLACNHRLDETKKFRSEAGMLSPQYAYLCDEIESDARAIYMHGLERASGGKFFAALKGIIEARGLKGREQHPGIDMHEFLAEARQLDKLFTDEPPKSPAEIRGRLHTYGMGLAFQLKAIYNNVKGEPFSTPGTYDAKWCKDKIEAEAMIAYYQMFPENRPASVESAPETAEKPLGEMTLEWWAHSRMVLTAMNNGDVQPFKATIESLRRELPRADKLSMRIFEAAACLDRWTHELSTSGFAEKYKRARAKDVRAPEDVAIVRREFQRLIDALEFQAFHAVRVDDLTEPQMRELLLAIAEGIRQLALARLPLAGEPLDDGRISNGYLEATHMSLQALYTLLRETGSSKLDTTAATFREQCRLHTLRRPNVPENDVLALFERGSRGLYEKYEISAVASAFREFPAVTPREQKAAQAALRKDAAPFTYRALLPSGEGASVTMSHDQAKAGGALHASVKGKPIPEEYLRQWHKPSHETLRENAFMGIEYDPASDVTHGFSAVVAATSAGKILVPPTQKANLKADMQSLAAHLPPLLAAKKREIGIICPHVPEAIKAKTQFIENPLGLFALCPTFEIAVHYCGPTDAPPVMSPVGQGFSVRLKTMKELEALYLTGTRVNGRFFPGTEPAGGTESPREPREKAQSDETTGEEAIPQRRMQAVRDVLLRNRTAGTVSYDSETAAVPAEAAIGETPAAEQFNFSEAPVGRWVIIDLPAHGKQIFVSDSPERTYVYPGIQPVADYLRVDALSPRQLQARGAKQIFWNTQDQFEASLTQAITAESWSQVDAGSVEAIIEHHGAHVRERLQALIHHVNTQPDRREPTSLETLTFGALRQGVLSGRAEREPHCGHTIVKDLARMAGYEDPIPYRVLREFFDQLIEGLNRTESGA